MQNFPPRSGLFRILVVLAMVEVGAHPALGLDPEFRVSQYVHRAVTIDDGLPQNSVPALTQSPKGYLWVATQEGAARYDGMVFENFNKSNTEAMTENYVTDVVSHGEHIWLATFGGGVVSIGPAGSTSLTVDDGLASDDVLSLLRDSTGRLWIGTANGVDVLADGTVTEFLGIHGQRYSGVRALATAATGELWIGSQQGLFAVDLPSQQARPVEGFEESTITALYSGEARLWVGTAESGLARLEGGRIEWFGFSGQLQEVVISALLVDEEEKLWIGTNHGLVRAAADHLEFFPPEHPLRDAAITSLFFDREGSLWVGTQGSGLHRLKNATFKTIGQDEGLPAEFFHAIAQDSLGAVWLGSRRSGVLRLEGDRVTEVGVAQGLPRAIVKSLTEDRDGAIWIGTSRGLFLLEQSTSREIRPIDEFDRMPISALFADSDGSLWIGSFAGLHRRDRAGVTRNPIASIPDHAVVLAIHRDRRGALWIGTDGLGVYRVAGDQVEHFTTDDGLGDDVIMDILEDDEGTMWFGSYSGGLQRFRDGRMSSLSRSRGLTDDLVMQVLEDDAGFLWMSCNRGIFRVSRDQANAVLDGRQQRVDSELFGREDGLRSRECVGGGMHAGLHHQDGSLWFPTTAGVAVVRPDAIVRNQIPPGIEIGELVVDGRAVTLERNPILEAGSDRVEFHFAGISLTNPAAVEYRYRLVSKGDEWVEGGRSRAAAYTNLSPGEYVFEVKARNEDGVWSEQPATLAFRLKPFFYETGLFYLFCAAAVLAAAVAGAEFRVRRSRQREAMLEDLVESRTANLAEEKRRSEQKAREMAELNEDLVLANQKKSDLLGVAAHDLKNPINQILGTAQILRNRLEPSSRNIRDLSRIEKASEDMVALITETLESAVLESGTIELRREEVEISGLAAQVVASHRVLSNRKDQKIRLRLNATTTVICDRGRIRECMENLVSNAIKFSPCGSSIEVAIEVRESAVRFSVRDEGPGVSEADRERLFQRFQRLSAEPTGGEHSTGLGLSIVKQLIDLHGGSVWVEEAAPTGAVFIFEIPLEP